jgi:hypothetical protein
MRSAIAKVKSILVANDFGERFDYFLLSDEQMLVTNGRMSAGTPCRHGISRLVPGLELDALASRLDGEVSVTTDEGSITLRAGRLRGTVKTLPPEDASIVYPDRPWLEPPPSLMSALRLARPFVAEATAVPWSTCVCLRRDSILATTTISLTRVDAPGLTPPGDCDLLVPWWAVDFAIGMAQDPDGVIMTPDYVALRWPDGTWLRTQLITGSFPPIVASMLVSVSDSQPVKISDEWRAAYLKIAEISRDVMEIGPGRIVGGLGRGHAELFIDLPGLTASAYFNPQYLTPALAVATSWDPGAYPNPVAFAGPGVRGLVAGRRVSDGKEAAAA